MPEQPEDRMSGSGSRGSRGSRRSRVTDQVREAPVVELADESAPASVYDDFTDRDSLGGHSAPPLPIKPPGNLPPGSIGVDPRLAGNTADEYYNDIVTTPSDEVPASPSQALSRRRTSSHGLSHSHSHSHSPSHGHSSRRTRSHSSAREVLRLLLKAEGSDSREALAMLRRAHDRLESENMRANEAERRVQEANDRWKVINQARLQAQAEASRINEELRLYKLQLETAQQQIGRANDMITQTDKEKEKAEDEAAKARRLAKKYEIESLIQKAREEGRRIGRQQGLQEGMENAYYDGRAYGRDYNDRDRELYENGRPYDEQAYDGRTIIDDDRYTNDYREDERRSMQYVPNPQGTADPRVQRSQPTPRTPTGIPPRMRSVPGEAPSRGPHNSILSGLSRLGRGRRHGPEMDRNVTVNPSNAPDVASIIDEMPANPITSPLPPEEISQVNHTTPVRMPEPDFNPDPNDVPPISMPNRPRSPAHPPIHIPPDGYIPSQGLDGSIRLPPPHELGQAPPTERSYNSPLPNASNLPPAEPAALPQRERSPITRDYGLPQEQQSRPSRRHRYQKSVADSDDSIATGAFSLVSPPDGRQSLMRDNRLSAIPEHDPRYASPSGSMRQAEGAMYPGTPRSRSSRRGDTYIPPESVMVEEPPVRPDLGAAFSPRSTRSGFGPPRPSRLTTPAPLAPSLGADNYDQPAYTRPRINSIASGSDIGGPIGGPGGTPRPSRSRNMTPASEYRRSRPPTAAGVQTPEITITQASRSNSLQSRTSNMPRDHISPRMSPYSHSMPVHASPSPVVVPGFPDGFVPNSTSPVIPGSTENLPRGFVPTPTMPTHDGLPPGFQPHSPSAPEGAPPGFMPSPAVQAPSLAPPDAPPGFVPDRPDISPGPPPGFIPGSPAPPGFVPGSPAPPGFLSASPAAPPGAPPGFVVDSSDQIPGAPAGFMPSSPMPDGAPPGFVPQSTSIPVSPLPVPITSPNMSVSGALPVLARSTSEKSAGFYDAGRARTGSSASRSPRLSFSGPNAGFHSRAASDWDTRSAWGDNRTERSPRPVRGPDLTSPRIGLEPEIIRPGSSLSRRDSSPVIPDPVTFQPSRANSSRRGSRVGFGDVVDPSGVPLPLSTAPSFARSGRATSDRSVRANLENVPPPAVVRSQSARSDVSRARGGIYTPNGNTNGMPTPSMGTPRHPSLSGLPPSGLGSPFSRRLDPHPEDADEYEVVASDVSQDTLTTPPAARRNLPHDRGTPAPPKRSLDPLGTRSPSANQTPSRRVSILAPADEPGPIEPSSSSSALRRSASRQSIASNKSYSKFDPNEYVDPAVLTSGRSRLLPLPVEEPVAAPAPAAAGGGKGRKNKKGKKK